MAGEHAVLRLGIPGRSDADHRRLHRRHPELVEEGRTGFTFESGNVSDLTDALIKASHAGENDYQIMQQTCVKYVNERCKQSQYVRQLEDSYRRIERGE